MVALPALEPANDPNEELADYFTLYANDPLGFVLFCFTWGQVGTALAEQEGPDKWQVKVLDRLGKELRKGKGPQAAARAAIRMAVRSGHGVGKTALVSWIILWFISTREDPQIVVTANTKVQLESKTWRELAKWHKLSIVRDFFKWTATKFYRIGHEATWFAKAIPWSINNSEAFAGTHDKNVLMLFDEASGIEDIIWEVAEGAMTTPGAMWLVFGNSTRNQGRFRECFRKYRDRWIGLKVDARTAKMANPEQLKEWEDDYGLDSDFFRIRVTGDFPRQDSSQWIGEDLVHRAARSVVLDAAIEHAPDILALDVGRFGNDNSVLIHRKGNRLVAKWIFPQLDTYQLAHRIMLIYDEIKPDAFFIEEVGIGVGVLDNLINAGYTDVTGVIPNMASTDSRLYSNWRMECWGELKKWLQKGGCPAIDGELDERLLTDLTTPLYMFDRKGRMQLESKKDMKARGMPSPDYGDALALSFARPVASKEMEESMLERFLNRQQAARGTGTTYMSR